MSLKAISYSLGCVIAWFVLLPLLVIGGGFALFAYATFAGVAFLTGNHGKPLDASAAREIAHRLCGGHSVRSRNTLR